LFVEYFIGTQANLGANAPNYAFPLPLILGIITNVEGIQTQRIYIVTA
jgi:aquaporin Z